MNIDLRGRLALIGGADGVLARAVRDALSDNGAETARLDGAPPSPAGAQAPYLLVLASRGADGLPETDAAFAGEAEEFARLVRAYAASLKRVVVLFSAAGLVPVRGLAAFSAGQAGIASLVRTLAMELGPDVAVNGVAVGDFEANAASSLRMLSHTALKRPAGIAEIVSAVLFLADPDNTYMTGHALAVDGGWSAGYARNF